MAALEGKEHFRRKGRAPEDVADKLSMEKIEVAGQVPDGEGTAGVLYRVTMQLDDFRFAVFGCYPVHEGEPASACTGSA